MIETPQTWLKISENYYVDYYENDILLLKQRENKVDISLDKQKSYTINKKDAIDIDNDYFKINSSLNLIGKFAKLFWKIPEVDMTVEYTSGKVETHRILLDNLCSGVDLSSVVYDTSSFIDYVNLEGKLSKVRKVSFSGLGLKFYKKDITITTYKESQDKDYVDNIQVYAPEVNLETDKDIMGGVQSCTDSVLRHDGITQIKGWAFLKEGDNKNIDIYIFSDGKFYRANREERTDVSDAFGVNEPYIGFNIDIANEIKEYQICILQNDKIYRTEEAK